MTPRRRDAAGTREAIVEAATRAFAERGFAGVTVRDIAAGAEVDPALVVRYFGSKAALFALTLGAGGPLLAAVLDGPLESLPERAAAFLASKATHTGPGGGDTTLSALVLSVADAEGRALLDQLIREHLEAPLVRSLQLAGVEPAEALLRARAVTAVILGQSLAATSLLPPQLDTARLAALLRAAIAPLPGTV